MVGARIDVLAQPGGHLVHRAMRDDGVDEPVAARFGQVLVGETEPLEVVEVVGQTEIDVERLAADRARALSVPAGSSVVSTALCSGPGTRRGRSGRRPCSGVWCGK